MVGDRVRQSQGKMKVGKQWAERQRIGEKGVWGRKREEKEGTKEGAREGKEGMVVEGGRRGDAGGKGSGVSDKALGSVVGEEN